MKATLLKKLRARGRRKITILSISTQGDLVVGMTIGYDDDAYSGIWSFGNSENDVLQKAGNIYLKENIDYIRKRYKKYSKLNQTT